jgi:hypothetical protein
MTYANSSSEDLCGYCDLVTWFNVHIVRNNLLESPMRQGWTALENRNVVEWVKWFTIVENVNDSRPGNGVKSEIPIPVYNVKATGKVGHV